MIATGLCIFTLVVAVLLKTKLNKKFYNSLATGVGFGAVWCLVDQHDGVIVRATAGVVVSYLVSYLLIARPGKKG